MTLTWVDEDGQRHIRCNCCNMLRINNINTHETGCPNTNKVFDVELEEWVEPLNEE